MKAGKGRVKLKTKYSSESTEYNGYNYDSKKEADYAKQLDLRIRLKEVKEWSRQHKFELYVNGEKICNYYIDFRVVMKDKSIEYVEVKGFETDIWRLKWRMTKALFDSLTKGEKAKLVLVK